MIPVGNAAAEAAPIFDKVAPNAIDDYFKLYQQQQAVAAKQRATPIKGAKMPPIKPVWQYGREKIKKNLDDVYAAHKAVEASTTPEERAVAERDLWEKQSAMEFNVKKENDDEKKALTIISDIQNNPGHYTQKQKEEFDAWLADPERGDFKLIKGTPYTISDAAQEHIKKRVPTPTKTKENTLADGSSKSVTREPFPYEQALNDAKEFAYGLQPEEWLIAGGDYINQHPELKGKSEQESKDAWAKAQADLAMRTFKGQHKESDKEAKDGAGMNIAIGIGGGGMENNWFKIEPVPTELKDKDAKFIDYIITKKAKNPKAKEGNPIMIFDVKSGSGGEETIQGELLQIRTNRDGSNPRGIINVYDKPSLEAMQGVLDKYTNKDDPKNPVLPSDDEMSPDYNAKFAIEMAAIKAKAKTERKSIELTPTNVSRINTLTGMNIEQIMEEGKKKWGGQPTTQPANKPKEPLTAKQTKALEAFKAQLKRDPTEVEMKRLLAKYK